MVFTTEQEASWGGAFGTEYNYRNQGEALRKARSIKGCIEFGANKSMNLKALKLSQQTIDTHAVEINSETTKQLGLREVIPPSQVHSVSIFDFSSSRQLNLTFNKSVLINVNPEKLPQIYRKLCISYDRHQLLAEHYNPEPLAIPYRGCNDRLFKRRSGREIMGYHSQMQLLDCGFADRGDPSSPQDDINWFPIQKRANFFGKQIC